MAYAISERKWYYLGIGILGPIFLFLPMVKMDGSNMYISNYSTFIESCLFAGLIYILMIVPFNFIYHRVYNEGYYNVIMKLIAVVISILAAAALIGLFFQTINFVGDVHFTIYFYILIIYLIAAHGLNLYVSFKESF